MNIPKKKTKNRNGLSLRLLEWYAENGRDLPWRHARDPYAVWVSEIMLQQTTVEAVIPFYLRWMERFPTVTDLARAPMDEVMRYWQGLGYYSRAVNLHRAAEEIIKNHGGILPQNEQALRGLPGIGIYTAAAVAAIAFDHKTIPLDSLVKRVLYRFFGYAQKERFSAERMREDGLILLSEKKPGDGVQALMDLANAVCRPKNPACARCPLRNDCGARREGTQNQGPEKRKVPIEDIDVVVGILVRNDSVLMQRRPDHGLFAGLWELPGGKVEPGESPEEAMVREWREEVGSLIRTVRCLNTVRHSYTRFRVRLHPFIVNGRIGKRALGERRRWIPLKELTNVAQPVANSKIWKMFFECYPEHRRI